MRESLNSQLSSLLCVLCGFNGEEVSGGGAIFSASFWQVGCQPHRWGNEGEVAMETATVKWWPASPGFMAGFWPVVLARVARRHACQDRALSCLMGGPPSDHLSNHKGNHPTTPSIYINAEEAVFRISFFSRGKIYRRRGRGKQGKLKAALTLLRSHYNTEVTPFG